jgi:hypothetical protein
MTEVFSIHNKIVKLKQLGLLDAEVNDQSKIDEILKSIIHVFKEFWCKHKSKDVCSLSELVSVAADSMMEPKSGMMVGETSFLVPKGKKEKKETKENDKVVIIGVNKARSKSKGKAKGIWFYCKEDEKWMRNCPKYLELQHSRKRFLLVLRYMFSKNPLDFLVCGFGTNTCLQLDCMGSRQTRKPRRKDRHWKFGVGMKIPKMSYLNHY